MKKTYIVDWTNKTRRGWRDYRKVVETDNIAEDVKDVMKIAKAEAIDRGFDGVHATTIEYKPKNKEA